MTLLLGLSFAMDHVMARFFLGCEQLRAELVHFELYVVVREDRRCSNEVVSFVALLVRIVHDAVL